MAKIQETPTGAVVYEIKCGARCGNVLGTVEFSREQFARRTAFGNKFDPELPLDGHLCDACAQKFGLKPK